MRSLNQLLWLQRLLVKLRWIYFTKFWGMDIHPSTIMSLSVRLDKTNPKGIHIGQIGRASCRERVSSPV